MHKYYLMVVLDLDLVDELVNLLEQTRLLMCENTWAEGLFTKSKPIQIQSQNYSQTDQTKGKSKD